MAADLGFTAKMSTGLPRQDTDPAPLTLWPLDTLIIIAYLPFHYNNKKNNNNNNNNNNFNHRENPFQGFTDDDDDDEEKEEEEETVKGSNLKP